MRFQYTKPVEDDAPEVIKKTNGIVPFSPILDKNKNTTLPISSSISPSITSNATTNVSSLKSANSTSAQRRKMMSDEEILERLRTIVSIGDPNRKYTKMEKIGQG